MKNTLNNTLTRLLLSITMLLPAASVEASSITSIYVFGDSLSDTATPINNNGLFWIEYLSPELGLNYDSSTNYAVSGSTTSNIYNQVNTYSGSTLAADPNALYIVWGGANDIFQAVASGSSDLIGVVDNAVTNIMGSVNTLSALGAQNILVANLPDLGLVPADGTGSLSQITQYFNGLLASYLPTNSNSSLVDIFSMHQMILADPASYGFTDTSSACSYTGVDCSTALYWDLVHPTTLGHQIIADQFYAGVSAVPVPAAFWLFGSGLITLIFFSRRPV